MLVEIDAFPPLSQANEDGLLAMGGDLSAARLEMAYRNGIFPWFSPNDPILWWSPDPRMVLYTDAIHISRSLQKKLSKQSFTITFNQAFNEVITACAAPRTPQHTDSDTWIVPDMIAAYTDLHHCGLANSVECWQDGKLVGGLYGVTLGGMFFGESMFSRVADASKVALITLCQRLAQCGFTMIDCQVKSDHLVSLGAVEIPRDDFIIQLNTLTQTTPINTPWRAHD